MKTDEIGRNAGVVWRLLNNNEKEMDMNKIAAATGLNILEVAAAIGWLSRENKLIVKENGDACQLTVFKECYY